MYAIQPVKGEQWHETLREHFREGSFFIVQWESGKSSLLPRVFDSLEEAEAYVNYLNGGPGHPFRFHPEEEENEQRQRRRRIRQIS